MFKLLLSLLLAFNCAHAAEVDSSSSIKNELQKNYPQLGTVEQVLPSPFPGLYEVVIQQHLFYTDEHAQYLIEGSLYDLKTMRNLTEERSRHLFAVDFNKLPLELAVKKVKGKGNRKMAYFTDPNCSFCKRLEHELQKVDNVTLYLFLYPIFPGSEEKARAVWCSKDRVKAWDNLMLKDIQPPAGNCDTPVAKVRELAAKMGVNGTPGLIFADGVLVPGYLPSAELEKALNSAAAH